MNRLGWVLLLLFLLVGAAFALMLRPGRTGEVAGAAPPPSSAGALIVPVEGVAQSALADTWGDARGGGTRSHHAIDIMAPRGTPVVAAAPGRIEKIFESRDGGHTIYERSVDGTRVYYYAHLDAYAANLREGLSVLAGQPIGTVGSSGDAAPDGPHLHFEVHEMTAGERWWQGREVNPYPLLGGAAPGKVAG